MRRLHTGECRRLRPLLVSYMDESLTPGQQQKIEDHLASCPECSAMAKSLRPIVADLIDDARSPGWQPTPEFQRRLNQSIRAEITSSISPRRFSLRRSWREHRFGLTLTGAAIAGIVLFAMILLVRPTEADTLSDALKAIHGCKTVHVLGVTRVPKFTRDRGGTYRGDLNNMDLTPFELWWTSEGKIWCRFGDSECAWKGNRAWVLVSSEPKRQWVPAEKEFLTPLDELTSPERYLNELRSASNSETALMGDLEIVTVEQHNRLDIIALDRHTKAMTWTRTFRKQAVKGIVPLRISNIITYNDPVPLEVVHAIESAERQTSANRMESP